MPLDRRQFLQGVTAVSGAAVLGGCADHAGPGRATPAGPTTTEHPGHPAAGTSASAGRGTLVLVTLDGGNDALNMVAPVGDSNYARLRGDLAIDPAKAHALTDGFALHPALAGCKQLWDAGRLAVVHGVGFAELDRSHFHCRDVWQSGDTHDVTTGWVGRWLDAVGTTPIDAISVGRTLPLLVRGRTRSAAVVPAGPFKLPGDARLRSLLTPLVAAGADRSPLAAAVAASNADLLTAVDAIGPALEAVPDDGGADGAADGSSLTGQLGAVARLIEADLPARVYTVTLGGFDTHAGQAVSHEALFGQLDRALTSFLDQVGDRAVTVAAFSEFGRRVAPNASAGTDHGKGGAMLLAGTVAAGHHGDPPPLARLDDGDLVTTTDFRSVMGGLAEAILGMPTRDLFGAGVTPLAVV